MSVVRLTIRESRTTVVTLDIDDELVSDPAERRVATLRAMLAQPAEAVLSGREATWSPTAYKITEVHADVDGVTYSERPW